jgi:RNAse (barnase) inhibitor barstar
VKTVSVKIDASKIKGWESFHSIFAEVMGFPDFYGKNMNAWIDCMSYMDDSNAGMTKIFVSSDEICLLEISSAADFLKRLPEIFSALVECTSVVNQRAKDSSPLPLLAIAFS